MEVITTDEGVKYLEIGHEPENGWIRCTWYGNVSMAYISKGSSLYSTLLKATGCSKLLNDNTHFEANWIALNDELEKGRMRESVANGLRYMAHVHSSKFITRFSAVDLGTRVKDFEFKLFEQLSEAEQWLRSVSNE
ncbi:MAG: hypothetical protein RIF36_26930 [Imperialibacter sp.]|uniref:hypothetical protein n=1 Tax=Imperialibacter sp. TaxID=2038411 RepID=UPI0032EE99C9